MKGKFKILSLDGGGVRGYLTTIILENLEKKIHYEKREEKPLGEYFDFIVGTSTGSIIAGLLSIGKSASEIKTIYENDIKEIFSKKMKRTVPLIYSKYSKEKLREKAELYFKREDQELIFNDVSTHLLITSVDILNMTPRLHKSGYHVDNLARLDEKISSAVIASCSAPSFFSVEKNLVYSTHLIDGGIVANNPSLIALIDAFKFDNINEKEISLLSIGTGKIGKLPYDLDSLSDSGYQWLRKKGKNPLIEILMQSQSNLAEFQTSFMMENLGFKNNYRRINPELKFDMELDDIDKIELLKNLGNLTSDDNRWIDNNII